VTLGALIRGARALQHAVGDWYALQGVLAAQRVPIVDELAVATTIARYGVVLSADIDEHVGIIVRSSSSGAATIEWLNDGKLIARGWPEATNAIIAVRADRLRRGVL